MSSLPRLVTKAAASLLDGNPEPRLPCLLLEDISGSMLERAPESMRDRKIDELNAGIRILPAEFAKDPLVARRVELAVVTFGGKVEVAQGFTPAASFKPPTFEAQGDTPMAEAILRSYDLIEERLASYEKRDLDNHGPWVCMRTDGYPTDTSELLEKARQRIHEADRRERGAKQIAFFAVGVEGADMKQLAWLSKRPPLKLKGFNYGRMFAWLAHSLQQVSRSQPGDRVRTEKLSEGGLEVYS